ncbi:hypothetical protein ACKGJO_06035 [Gracilimonas sp. Q87]|uniref:hypothetical protein n=1 Tax=Gracilimonas sp. Q87 TaxID=3384766 RepID=UPI003984185A
MTLIPKISRLKKIPHLLKRKKDAEERSKKKKNDSEDKHPPFEIDDKISLNPEAITDLKIHQPPTPNRQAKSSNEPEIGNNIDLTV